MRVWGDFWRQIATEILVTDVQMNSYLCLRGRCILKQSAWWKMNVTEKSRPKTAKTILASQLFQTSFSGSQRFCTFRKWVTAADFELEEVYSSTILIIIDKLLFPLTSSICFWTQVNLTNWYGITILWSMRCSSVNGL